MQPIRQIHIDIFPRNTFRMEPRGRDEWRKVFRKLTQKTVWRVGTAREAAQIQFAGNRYGVKVKTRKVNGEGWIIWKAKKC